jgi:hypothetical protein
VGLGSCSCGQFPLCGIHKDAAGAPKALIILPVCHPTGPEQVRYPASELGILSERSQGEAEQFDGIVAIEFLLVLFT